jgi:predicted DNA-binding transcriptional regulator YafY
LEGAKRGMTAAQLKEAIEETQSTRTLYRDLEVLQQAGFPLTNEDGCWRLLETSESSWAIPVNPTEVVALMLTEDLLAPVEGSWLAEPLANLRSRLSSTLTPTGRRYCAELRKANVATVFGSGHYGEKRAELEAIHEAIEKQHRVRIDYATPGKATEARTIDPYCTWFAAGSVYVVAYCHKAEDTRTFAVQRIKHAEVLDQSFDPDPAAFTRKGFGVYHGPVYRVTIDFSPKVAHLIRERRFHVSQQVTDVAKGVRLKMEAAGLPEIAAWVAGFGGEARVVAPKELVAAVKALHRRGFEVAETGWGVTSDDTREL